MAFSFRVGTNWCHDFPKLARDSGFYFNMHRSRVRVDWNRICNINIEQVIRERDFSVIDENVNNVIDYCLESEYDVKILDPNFVKLFRLAQLAVEYLLYCKQYLDHSIVILKDELKLKIEENVKLKKESAASEEIIKQLKEKSREKGKFIEAKISECNGEIYKCPHCPKTFISALFLNAHVTRRHVYMSDLCYTSSPMHEHYRTETEKLHNEIKSLKERLNQTEKVIKTESDKISCKANLEKRLSDNEIENSKRDSNKSSEYQEHKGYQDEISTLKSMVFEEIHNLRQRERMMYEHPPETNVKALISQQEKEFQKLKNQLFEKLTPDIENMNTKLHAQEDYWRTKIENIEYQHQKDIEKLTVELKLTQKAADRIKLEYESKVSDLERESTNQTNILHEQSKQLHSLSREMNNSQSENCRNHDNNLPDRSSQSVTLEQRDSENDKQPSGNDLKHTDHTNAKALQMTVEDTTSVSSYDSPHKLVSLGSKSKLLPKSIHVLKSASKTITAKSNENAKQRPKHAKKSNTAFENVNDAAKNLMNCDSTDMSESQDSMHEKQIDYESKRTKYDSNDRLSKTNLNFEKSSKKQPEKIDAKHIEEMLPIDLKSNPKKTEILEDELTSETKSESATLDSQTESESESLTTIRINPPVHESKTSSVTAQKSRKVTRHGTSYKKLQMDLQELFDKRLRDLGIDPEWQGIPKATFKQKMDILKHHQNITAKKLPKYHQIRLKLIEEVVDKVSKTDEKVDNFKYTKKSPLNKLVKNMKSKAMKVFSNQKIPDKHSSVSKLQESTPKRFYSKLEMDHQGTPNENENNEITNSSSVLSRSKNITNSYHNIKSPSKHSTPISNYKSIESEIKFSPSFIRSKENLKQKMNSHESLIKNLFDSSNKMRSVFDTPTNSKETLVTKSSENNDLISTNMQQELGSVSMSPKSNKSVLKSTTGSTGSLMKKKVIFDLTNDKNGGSSLEYDTKAEDVNDSNWNALSMSDKQEHLFHREDYKNTSNIVLKTSQSDKIAAISRKLEAQLSMVRQKPVGSVETIFSSKYVQDQEFNKDEDRRGSSASIDSLLGTPRRMSAVSFKMPSDLLPRPAPRNLKEKVSMSEGSDLDSDIDQILKLD